MASRPSIKTGQAWAGKICTREIGTSTMSRLNTESSLSLERYLLMSIQVEVFAATEHWLALKPIELMEASPLSTERSSMMSNVKVSIDPSIKISDILKAAESIGCRLMADEDGIKVVKRAVAIAD